MKPDFRKPEEIARADRENTARFVFQALAALPHPGDAAAVIATVHAMLIQTQRVTDEAVVRKIMAQLTEITVDMWKVQQEKMERRNGNVDTSTNEGRDSDNPQV